VQLARGGADRDVVISRWGSYHGATLGTLGVSGKPSMRAPYEPMFRDAPHIEPPYCYRCPFDLTYPACEVACARQLESAILEIGPHRVAAFLAEPVGGATLGAIEPPPNYWSIIRGICDRYRVLLIADEVLTGFGRTGAWFAMEHFGVEPDVITLAKGAAGGYFPLSIAAVRGTDVEAIRVGHGNFNHGGTFSHHAVGAAAAMATMDYLEAHDLVARAARMGEILGTALRTALQHVPAVGDVRGIGMMWAIELVAGRETKEPFSKEVRFADRVCARCMADGVLLYPGRGSAGGGRGDHLMVAPPFVVTEDQITSIVDVLRRAVMWVQSTLS
jgi:adenosylmethionine-8-amino-7-oxononanoate aminotransferase